MSAAEEEGDLHMNKMAVITHRKAISAQKYVELNTFKSTAESSTSIHMNKTIFIKINDIPHAQK